MHDGTYNMALAASLNMDMAAHKERSAALEQLVKDAAALLQEVPDFDSDATHKEREAWSARRTAVLKRIEQEVK